MTILIFISFVSASVWKGHTIFMYYIYSIEENNVSQENPYYIIWYLKINNCIVKTILSCVYNCEGNYHVTKPFNNSLM